MKIWIDARKASQENYLGLFIRQILKEIKNSKNEFVVFIDKDFTYNPEKENIVVLKTDLWNSLKEEMKMWKIMNKQKLDNALFFDASMPINYKKDYFVFPWVFDRVIYNKWVSKINELLINIKLRKAKKIICFTEKQKWDVNEMLNIKNSKIEVVKPWFKSSILNHSKYELPNKFIICDITWDEKTIKQIIKTISEIKKLNLVIFWEDKYKKKFFTDYIKIKGLEEKVSISDESYELYEKALAYIYTKVDSSYPFSISKSLEYNLPIISPKNQYTKEILWKSVFYFSTLSNTSLKESIEEAIRKENVKYDEQILESDIEKII